MSQFIGLSINPNNRSATILRADKMNITPEGETPQSFGPYLPYPSDNSLFDLVTQRANPGQNNGIRILNFTYNSNGVLSASNAQSYLQEINNFSNLQINLTNRSICQNSQIEELPIIGISLNFFGQKEVPFPHSYGATVVFKYYDTPEQTLRANVVHECSNFYSLVFTDGSISGGDLMNTQAISIRFDAALPQDFGSFGISLAPATCTPGTMATREGFGDSFNGIDPLIKLVIFIVAAYILYKLLVRNQNIF